MCSKALQLYTSQVPYTIILFLIMKPSHHPLFDHLQFAKVKGKREKKMGEGKMWEQG